MAISVRGDFNRLAAWKKMFDTAPELLAPMSKDMAEEMLGKVQDGFRDQADPYGERWAPKKRPDGRAILVGKTTRLRRGWHVERATRDGFRIIPSVDYVLPHQAPRKNRRPRRAMVPYKGLPLSWKTAMHEVARDHLRAHFSTARNASAATARFGGAGGGRSLVAGKLGGLKRRMNPIALVKKALKAVEGK